MENWETSKENVMPIKRGRSTKGLNDALQNIEETNGNKNKLESLELAKTKEFDEKLEKLSDYEDILNLYIGYYIILNHMNILFLSIISTTLLGITNGLGILFLQI